MKKTLVTLVGVLCVSTLVAIAQDASTNVPTVPPSLGSTTPSAAATTDAPAKPVKHARHAKRVLTTEQKALLKEMLAKYDANKDGKLDKKERAKMTKEDKQKCKKADLFTSKKKGGKKADTK